jgi:protein-disulfide isomerase
VRQRLALGALLAVALLLAGACGDDDASDAATDATATASGTGTGSNPGSSATKPAETAAPTGEFAAFEAIRFPPDLVDGQAAGAADAPVTLTLFEDFQCPFCLAFNLEFEELLLNDYLAAGDVRLEFVNFPILGEESVTAARGSFCAAEQDVFWEFHNRLFLEQAKAGQLRDEQLNVGRFSVENLRAWAVEAGADGDAFDACLADDASLRAVQEQYTAGRGLGITGTPGVVVNGTAVPIPRDQASLRKLLDDAIAAAE